MHMLINKKRGTVCHTVDEGRRKPRAQNVNSSPRKTRGTRYANSCAK